MSYRVKFVVRSGKRPIKAFHIHYSSLPAKKLAGKIADISGVGNIEEARFETRMEASEISEDFMNYINLT